jgi:hypothetical protein
LKYAKGQARHKTRAKRNKRREILLMRTKYKISPKTRRIVYGYIQSYDEYLAWYQAEKEHITNHCRENYSGMPFGSDVTDPTEAAAEKYEKLDESHKAKVIKAIDMAKYMIGCDILDENNRQAVMRAIWLSCINRYEYNFEAFDGLISCQKTKFYEYKNEFVFNIKKYIEL